MSLSQVIGKKIHSGSNLQRGWSITGLKLQTHQFILSDVQGNGTHYSILSQENRGQKGLALQGSALIQSAIFIQK
jgi:hypothetical protein